MSTPDRGARIRAARAGRTRPRSGASGESSSGRLAAAIFALLLVVGFGLALLRSVVPAESRLPMRADAMAFLGHAWLLENGAVSGRDFGAAYGPVPQLLARLAVALRAEADWEGAAPMIYLVFRWAGLAAFGLWMLLLPRERARELPVLAAVALVFGVGDNAAALRIGAALLALRAAAAYFRAADDRTRRPLWLAATALGATVLFSIDVFVYAIGAIWIGALLLWATDAGADVAARRRPVRRVLSLSALAALGLVALVAAAAVTAVEPSQRWSDAPRRAWELAVTYPQTFGRPWEGPAAASVVWALAVLLAVVGALLRVRRSRSEADLALLAPFALLSLKGAVTRSDAGHIALGLLPAALLLALVALRSGRPAMRLAAAVLLVAMWFSWPPAAARGSLETGNPIRAWSVLRHRRPDESLFPRRLIEAAKGPGPVAVFPLQIGLAALMERPLVARFDQAYAARTPALQSELVAQLEAGDPALEVVYGLDGVASWAVDGVQSIARSPVIFEHLVTRFERRADRVVDRGFFLLERRSDPRELAWRPLELEPEGGERRSFRVASPPECALLRLEMRLSYPWWRSLGWPAGVRVIGLTGSRTILRSRLVPLEIGRFFVTYLSPLRAGEFACLFDDGPPPAGPRIDRFEIQLDAGGPFGIAPERVELGRVECLE